MIHAGLYTLFTETKGWGVFTKEFIPADTVVELSPVIVMSKAEKKLLDKTTLYNYIFDWDEGKCCMAMGLIPVYNHDYRSNCEYYQDYEAHTIFIKTMRDILPGEELTINYNGDWDNDKKVWFEVI
jgi:SET domain-containing protein